MPRAKADASQSILIELDTPNRSHVVAGDVLTGIVTLKAGTQLPVDQVKLTLFGRTKTKISRKNANNITSVYRGRRVFFEIHKDLSSVADSSSGSQVWPFSITIPDSPASCTGYGDAYKPAFGYWSTELTADKTNLSFPSTYYYYAKPGFTSSTTAEAYVEYALKAELSGAKSSKRYCGATALAFRARSTEHAVSDFKFRSQKFPVWIKSARLEPPPHEKPSLSAKESFKNLFKSTPTPRYAFSLKVDIPTVVQLEHPNGIPLRVEVIPDLTSGNTTISPDMFPDVKVVSLSLSLRAITCIRSPTTFSSTESEKQHTFHIATNRALNQVIPNRQFASAEGDLPEVLDMGEILKLQVNRTRAEVQGTKSVDFERPLAPTFSTYNIQVRHQLDWKMVYECAGESKTISNQGPVVVLAPSEADVRDKENSWMGTERGKDYDGIKNGVELASQGLEALANLLSA